MNALTLSHITTLMTLGVLVSAGISLIVEWVAKGMPKKDGAKSERESRFRRRAPLIIGVGISAWGFPAAWSVVVGPLTLEVWWHYAIWAAVGSFAGVVAGVGARGAVDLGRAVLERVK